jgi:hypothetical protein
MIRTAQAKDIEQCIELLKDFANASLYDYSQWQDKDVEHARRVLFNLMKNEYLKVAELDGKIIGMIGAQREQDPWLLDRQRIRELFWWMTPEYRGTRWSALLFKQWQADTDRWIKLKIVDQVSLSTQPMSSQIELNKRGWQCVEQHWIKG